jgi:gluconolactonase
MRHVGWVGVVLCLAGAGVVVARAVEGVAAVDKAEFAKILAADARVEKLAGGMTFTEGPVWFDDADGGHLIFSDIPANQLKKWSAKGGLGVFRAGSNYANGNTRDREGRLITCEHAARRVTRTEKDGRVTVLADRFEGKRFNSPNDAAVKSDGTVWFTDPPYGTPKGEARELDKQNVFRLDPASGRITVVAADIDRPNGLAFSPDEKRLYVADSGKVKQVYVFEVKDDGTLDGGRVFCTIDKGAPDGIRVDAAGRLFSSSGDGVQIFSTDGKLIGRILLPESCANVAFGGAAGDELYMTAMKSLYRIKLAYPAVRKP